MYVRLNINKNKWYLRIVNYLTPFLKSITPDDLTSVCISVSFQRKIVFLPYLVPIE